jgi:PAS domain S-box-containing protein
MEPALKSGSSRKPRSSSRPKRQQSERELAELQRMLASIVEFSDDAIISKTLDGVVTSWNKGAERIFGYTAEEMIGHPISVLSMPDRLPEMPRILERIRSGEHVEPYETVRRHKHGHPVPISLTVSPIRDHVGRIVGASKVARDISEHQRAVRALREGQERLKAALEASQTGTFSWNLQTGVSELDENLVRLFGMPSSQTQTTVDEFLTLVHPEDQSAVLASSQRSRSEGADFEMEFRVLWPDQSVHWVYSRGKTSFDETGRPAAMIGACVDITERRKLIEREAQALDKAHEENRFRRLLEAAPDAILEVDARGQIVLLNQVAETMFGYSREELLGLNVESLVPEAMRGIYNRHRVSYAAAPQTRSIGTGLDLKVQRKNGSLFPVEIRLSPNWNNGVLRVIALVRDISERKESQDRLRAVHERHAAQMFAANQQLESRNEEVEKANRLKSEFLASMSHELRTPLHTIIGFSELLTEELEGPLNAKQKRFLGHVLQDSRHLLQLINEILDISKIEAGRLELQSEAFDFAACVGEVLAGIQPQAVDKSIRVENRNTFADLLYADRLRIKEILYNLLGNAIKFTSDGGLVWVEAIAHDGILQVTVGDNGIGIPPEEQTAIFEKFYQVGSSTSGVREGTGLGLPITKKLVELHGGKIWVESQPGEGSRFNLILPLQGHHFQEQVINKS